MFIYSPAFATTATFIAISTLHFGAVVVMSVMPTIPISSMIGAMSMVMSAIVLMPTV